MFGHNGNELPYCYSSEYLGHLSLPVVTTASQPEPASILPSLTIPGNEYDTVSALKSELGYSSSGCSSFVESPSSITSYGTYSPTIIQRSISSLSLHRNSEGYSPMDTAPMGLFDSETSSVRKVLSTGDLQGINLAQQNQRTSSSLSNEVSIIESMSKACRYSPEEKKERIERYRNKKNLRNFNKKIKYECRKTLADSRPRIRGRFARNDDTDKTPQSQWDHTAVEEDDEDDYNWINFLDAIQQI